MTAIICIALFVGGVLALLWLRNRKRQKNAWKQAPIDRAIRIMQSIKPVKTPQNHNVYFEKGTDPNVFSLAAVDSGIEKCREKAECAGYVVDRSLKQNIVVFASMNDSQGNPAYKIFITHTNPYYQSEWDMAGKAGLEVDHYILAAGQTILVNHDAHLDTIIIPHHSGKEAHLETVVIFENEHVLLFRHDPEKYAATEHHIGNGHPLIQDCVGTTFGLASRPFTGLCPPAQH